MVGWGRIVRNIVIALALPLSVCPAGRTTVVQSATSEPGFEVLMKEAQAFYSDRKLDDAYLKFEAIRNLAHERHDELWEARGTAGLASVFYRQAKYPQARENFLKALPIFERLGALEDSARTHLGLGNVSWYMGELADAKGRYQAAISLYEVLGDIRSRVYATLNLKKLSKPGPELLPLVEQLRTEANSLGDKRLEASVLHSWGDELFHLGEYGAALEKLERAAALYQEAGDQASLAEVYNSLGRIYRGHGQGAAALDYQLKALDIQESLNVNAGIIQSLNAVAVAYESLGELKAAERYYERAIVLADNTGSPRIQDFLRANLAHFLIRDGRFSRGAEMLEQVLARGLDTHTSTRNNQLSIAYMNLGRGKDALATAQKALDDCSKESENACLHALWGRARVNYELGNKTAAETDLRSALNKIEEVHSRLVPEDFFKQELHHSWEQLYSLAIELNVREGNAGEALETAELARSRALLDVLAARRLAVRDRIDRSEAPVTLIPSSLSAGGTLSKIADTQSTGSSASRGLASPLAVAAPAVPDISAMAARLKSTFVIYWVSDDAVFIWLVDSGGVVRAERVAILRSRLQSLVKSTLTASSEPAKQNSGRMNSVRSRGDSAVVVESGRAEAWGKLYDILIRPVRKYLPRESGARLTIVPHGPLLNLSFAALRDPGGSYLIERYALHYVPASAVLQFTAANHRPNARTGQILIAADPDSPAHPHGEPEFPRLPGARAEASAIAGLFPKSSVTFLRGKDATEAKVRDGVSGKSVIHFATHAIAMDQSPFDSYLALAASTDSATEGLLTAQKIYGLNLDADMVVLSACRSGGGLVTGDGIAALGRAFFYAGTSSVVASLWNIPDKPTDRLLADFYRAWLRGKDKDQALREAQLGLLRQLRAGKVSMDTPIGEISVPEDPGFWAGFILLGEPE